MKILASNLMSSEQEVDSSSVYIGYLVLKLLKDVERVSIFELMSDIKKNNRNVNYTTILYGLIFLFMNGIIDFDEPYIYKLSNIQ